MDYRNAKLECAANGGYIVEYDEVTKAGTGSYGTIDYKRKEEVFPEGDGEKALDRLRELSGHKPMAKKEEPAKEY